MTDPTWRDEDRRFFEEHFREIAERLTQKGVIPSHRKEEYRVEMDDGRVFKFAVTGYLKKGSKADLEHKRELAKAVDEFVAEYGDIEIL